MNGYAHQADIEKYFLAEKQDGLIFLVIGVAAILGLPLHFSLLENLFL
jgi:hypothetical protein